MKKILYSVLVDEDQLSAIHAQVPEGVLCIASRPMSEDEMLSENTWECRGVEIRYGFHRAAQEKAEKAKRDYS